MNNNGNNMNNVVDLIMRIMTNGQNPNQVVEQLINNNPQARALFTQMKQNNMSIKDFTLQYAKQNNINIEPILNTLSQRGIKL